MNRTAKKILSIATLVSVSFAAHADSQVVTPKYTIRSQGVNAARRIAGNVGHEFLADTEDWNGHLSVALEYSRSFREKEIAKCLFGDKLCGDKILKIQGSRVTNRDSNALLADYFYLPTDFKSEVCVNPRIQNFVADLRAYVGLDAWAQGLYFWVNVPITYTKWDLNFGESVKAKGTNDHDAGYFTPDVLPRTSMLNNFSEYASGKAPAAVTQSGQDFSGENPVATDEEFTVTFRGLKCAKLCGSSDTKTTVADIRATLGWNFLLHEDYHLGVGLQFAAPTGNDVKSEFLFSPQNGNDDHFEFGGQVSFHGIFWRSEEENKHFGFHFDANLTHMFGNKQCRCFDLCGKPLSRYMLAEKLGTEVEFNLEGAGTDATSQFKNEFAPVANITESRVKVSVGVQADIVAMFNYTSNNWSWDIGYNLWARSCEKIRLRKNCPAFETCWALKGDAHVFGFEVQTASTLVGAVPLSATQCDATICGGQNFGNSGATSDADIAAGRRNPKINNPVGATGSATRAEDMVDEILSSMPDTQATAIGDEPNINTSIQAVFIKQSDIDFARTKGVSHKVFTHLDYSWRDRESRWIPHVGVGFEAEFGQDSSSCKDSCCPTKCDTDCDTKCDTKSDTDCKTSCKTSGNCVKCALSQWGIWLKAGVSYS